VATKTSIQLTDDNNLRIPDNNERLVSPEDVRSQIKDVIDSMLNIKDGGLVIQSETGYSTAIYPTSNYSFATKKYVDDATAGIDLSEYIRLDGESTATTGDIFIGPNKGLVDLSGSRLRFDSDIYIGSVNNIILKSATNLFKFRNITDFNAIHDYSAIAGSDKTITWKNETGTVALLSDITAISGSYIKTAGTSMLTANVVVAGNENIYTYQYNDLTNTNEITFYEGFNSYATDVATDLVGSLEHTRSAFEAGYTNATTGKVASLSIRPADGIVIYTGGYPVNIKADNTTVNYNIQIPDKAVDQTLAMTSDIAALSTTYVAKAGDTMTGQLSAPSYVASGTAGAGYARLSKQSSRPTGVSGNINIYSSTAAQAGELAWSKLNNASSLTIYREFVFPDANTTITFPTPDAGGADAVAYLGTAQTFTAINTFSNASGLRALELYVNDPSLGYRRAIYSTTTTQLEVGGLGFPRVNMSGMVFQSSAIGAVNSITGGNSGLGISSTTPSAGNAHINISSTLLSSVTANAWTGNLTNVSGNLTNAATVSTQSTGWWLYEAGTVTGGSGVRGNAQFFGGSTPIGITAAQGMQRGFYEGNATAAPSGNPSSGQFRWTASGDQWWRSSGGGVSSLGTAGLSLQTAGQGILIKEGTNATMGVVTLVAGTATISTTKVTANSRIFVTRQTTAGTIGTSIDVTARTAGTSFTITSNGSVLDTSTVAWFIVEPN